jgi:hypothetical protein
MTDASSVYHKARGEVASMLGFTDLDNLSPEQSLRLDIACSLRVLLDAQSGRLLRGESLDAREMLAASEALARLLPPLREPPPAANRVDVREIMWQTYLGMRRRGELGNAVVEAREVDRLRARVAELEAELAGHPPAESAPPAVPPADNVVPLPKPTNNPVTLLPREPWREYMNAHYDPWADNRR